MKRTRKDGRSADTLRAISYQLRPQKNPEGSVRYSSGNTSVLVAATVDEGVREFMKGTGKGWITAEYAMHPRANPGRQSRDGRRNSGVDGRTHEIQRLIGRALRAAVVPAKLGERTITLDCDVLDADGGTRTASVSGGFIALAMALDGLRQRGLAVPGVLRAPVAAVSVGLVDGVPVLDLDYLEDRDAQVDLNVVATEDGDVIEIQGTAEEEPMRREQLDAMVTLALQGIREITQTQRAALKEAGVDLQRLLA